MELLNRMVDMGLVNNKTLGNDTNFILLRKLPEWNKLIVRMKENIKQVLGKNIITKI